MTDQHGGPGWYPDPYHRYQYRFFNGHQWTADVSVEGRRFVDSAPLASAYQPMFAPQTKPKRGFAVASMVIAICSVVVAWMPFLFATAVVGVILAVIFGIIGLRRAGRPDGDGRGFAVAGLVLAGVALLLVPVGVLLSARVIDEIRDLADPGPYRARITSCEQREISTLAKGEITNLDDRTRGYDITVVLRDSAGRIIDRTSVVVDPVLDGDTETFSVNLIAEPGECEIYDVGSTLFVTAD